MPPKRARWSVVVLRTVVVLVVFGASSSVFPAVQARYFGAVIKADTDAWRRASRVQVSHEGMTWLMVVKPVARPVPNPYVPGGTEGTAYRAEARGVLHEVSVWDLPQAEVDLFAVADQWVQTDDSPFEVSERPKDIKVDELPAVEVFHPFSPTVDPSNPSERRRNGYLTAFVVPADESNPARLVVIVTEAPYTIAVQEDPARFDALVDSGPDHWYIQDSFET